MFSEAQLISSADFIRTKFVGNTFFVNAQFMSTPSFQEGVFSGNAFFGNARFLQGARFRQTEFRSVADFSRASITQMAMFERAQFRGKAGFAETQFNQGADFTLAVFDGEAMFDRTLFGGPVIFTFADLQKANFRSLDLQQVRFGRSRGLESTEFSGIAEWAIWPSAPSKWRRQRLAVVDELDARALPYGRDRQMALSYTEHVYRSIRRSHESRNDHPRASDFYFGEMEMRRLAISPIYSAGRLGR